MEKWRWRIEMNVTIHMFQGFTVPGFNGKIQESCTLLLSSLFALLRFCPLTVMVTIKREGIFSIIRGGSVGVHALACFFSSD